MADPGLGPDVVTAYGYDPSGNATTVWSPSAVAGAANNTSRTPTLNEFTFDNLLGATVDPVSPDGSIRRRTSFGYDVAGRKTSEAVAQVLGAGVTPDPTAVAVGDKAWSYAPNGWLLAETGRDGTSTITHTYAANGLSVSVADGAGRSASAGYYLNGWVRETRNTRGANDWVRQLYLYRGDGLEQNQLNYERRPAYSAEAYVGGHAVAFNDAQDLTVGYAVVTRPPGSTGYTLGGWARFYTPDGRLSSGVDTTGHALDFEVGADGTLTSQSTASSTGVVLDAWAYSYDATGRVASRARGAQAPESFGYDPHGRLTSWDGQAIGYDPNGNRTSYAGSTSAYRADNSPTTGASGAYSYDEAGRTLGDGCTTYGYDAFDRNTTTDAPLVCNDLNQFSSVNTFDPLGRVIRTVTNHLPLVTRNDDRRIDYRGMTDQVIADIGTPLVRPGARYVYGPDGPAVASTVGSALGNPVFSSLGTDGQGNVVMTAPSGATASCKPEFDPWGNPEGVTAFDSNAPCGSDLNVHNTLWYGAGRRDITTGSYTFGARTYYPSTATWLTPDFGGPGTGMSDLSVGTDPLTQNRYSYVNGDPINLSDPTGHIPQECTTGELKCTRDGGKGWRISAPVPPEPKVSSTAELREAMDVVGLDAEIVDAFSAGFDEHDLEVLRLDYRHRRVFILSDGNATAIFVATDSGTLALVQEVPTDLTRFARGIGKAVTVGGIALTAASIATAAHEGWQASEGRPLPERLLAVVEAAGPEAVQAGIDWAAFQAGSRVCASGGPVASGFCGVGSILAERALISFSQASEAPPSYCRGGVVDRKEMEAMGFYNATEYTQGC